ncbi:poly-beta-1,6 N-acetyl-D-glucosamine export porin PgaA [Sulfuriferula nivalis]|uniref:Poly-beta-1,6 N-acetyl-D-glucosamine export porin PgaA n=1 Tax=Sulfuriferula nivalis TaxID=2675298 RepID=A0A809RU77_9PROT|nr:poly-beta-1,6 N-acetyl-D-glucosamine export porin PgaA [Sulfuriferula nivalis]BBP02471.1 poly-beta-1,6 N-acetyl-D-glucosamine export porin PgaA [Sulfuriferula nivalis]
MNKKSLNHIGSLRLISASLMISGLFNPNVYASDPVVNTTAARHQAMADARAGHLEAAIKKLTELHASAPNDMVLTADLMVLLRQAGRNAEIIALSQQAPITSLPDYALMPLAGALRDEKKFVGAQHVLADSRQRLGSKAQILYAVVTVEAGQPKEAIAALPPETTANLDGDDFAGMAYVYRMAGNPAQSERLATIALTKDPDNKLGARERVFGLADLGASSMALQYAQQRPKIFTQYELDYLSAEQSALNTRNAYQERRRLDTQDTYRQHNQALQASLAELDANLVKFANEPDLLLRTHYDHIFVLSSLEMMPQAIDEYSTLKPPIPSYVRGAAADAYLKMHQPEKAAPLYEQLIKENPLANVEVYMGLYFSYVESERYDDAARILAHVDKTTPIWHNGQAANVERLENWERVDVDDQLVMDAAYRNQDALAEQRIDALVQNAPRNDNLINTKATIERWRGLPLKSMVTTQQAAIYAPNNKDTRINLANNARDLGQYDIWGKQITSLMHDFPTDNSLQIKSSYEQWQDRSRPSISSEYTYGTSRGNATLVRGSADQELLTTLNSPWTASGWRGFVQQHYIWGDYDTGALNYNRLGLGAEWEWGRKHAWGVLSNDQLTGNHVGVAGGWSQWLNDNWQYTIAGDTYSTDTPLRAKEVGLSGKSIGAGLIWRQNESRNAYMNLTMLDISDGNKRIDFSTGISQRLWANAHHITTGGIDLDAERNTHTSPNDNYFNPASTEGASLRLEHSWITGDVMNVHSLSTLE